MALLIVKVHGDGITFYRVNVYPVTDLGSKVAAAHAGTNNDAIKWFPNQNIFFVFPGNFDAIIQ